MIIRVDDDECLLFEKNRICCVPTTEEEKEFIKKSTDEHGNIKPSVYNMLYNYRDGIVDNIFHDSYGDDNRDAYIASQIIKDEVERLRDKEEDKWTIKKLPFLKPSTLCLIDLFYTINNNREMTDKIIKAGIDILLKDTEEEKWYK
jgi:hypothetical protein